MSERTISLPLTQVDYTLARGIATTLINLPEQDWIHHLLMLIPGKLADVEKVIDDDLLNIVKLTSLITVLRRFQLMDETVEINFTILADEAENTARQIWEAVGYASPNSRLPYTLRPMLPDDKGRKPT